MKKLFIIVLITMLLSACLPQGVRVPQSELQPLLERKSGLIAYIGADGNLYVSDQGGGKKKQITKDAFFGKTQNDPYLYYRAPTWSKDSSKLAFASESFDGKVISRDLLVANVEKGSPTKVFKNQSEVPIYLYWSPDNKNLSFISTVLNGQNIVLQSVPAAGGKGTILDVGAPYYWSWAPNGRTLIAHSGGGSNASVPDHLTFIQVQDSEVTEDGLPTLPASFQAPAWSPDGHHITLTRTLEGKKEIIITDSAGAYQKTLGTFTLNTAFVWSPDSTKLAYIDGTQAMTAGVLGKLNIVDIAKADNKIIGDDVIGLFWSPNSEKVAYYRIVPDSSSSSSDPSSQQFALELNVLDMKSGESRKLYTISPTRQFMNILPYFDQYAQSSTIWSPDSNNLLICFVDGQGNPGIAIASASGNLQPRLLADGYLAFWSWK